MGLQIEVSTLSLYYFLPQQKLGMEKKMMNENAKRKENNLSW